MTKIDQYLQVTAVKECASHPQSTYHKCPAVSLWPAQQWSSIPFPLPGQISASRWYWPHSRRVCFSWTHRWCDLERHSMLPRLRRKPFVPHGAGTWILPAPMRKGFQISHQYLLLVAWWYPLTYLRSCWGHSVAGKWRFSQYNGWCLTQCVIENPYNLTLRTY